MKSPNAFNYLEEGTMNTIKSRLAEKNLSTLVKIDAQRTLNFVLKDKSKPER